MIYAIMNAVLVLPQKILTGTYLFYKIY